MIHGGTDSGKRFEEDAYKHPTLRTRPDIQQATTESKQPHDGRRGKMNESIKG